jgi:hypothetical protein
MAQRNKWKRVPQWQKDLLLWGNRQRRMKWAWGETDCGTLLRQGLEIVFGQPVMTIQYASREEAQTWMRQMGTSATAYFEKCGAVQYPLNELIGGDVIVRPRTINKLPRLALALDEEVLITSDPIQGPHWIGTQNLRSRARVYRFGT